MNLGAMKTAVKLHLGNLPYTDVYITNNQHIDWLNSGVQDVVLSTIALRENFNLFPELEESWTVGPTTDGDNSIAEPTDAYVITGVASYDKGTAVASATDETTPMTRISKPDFDLLDKTATGWPTLWCWHNSETLVYPTPTTAFLTYLEAYGLKRDEQFTSLSLDSESYTIKAMWHDAVVLYAARRGALAKRWFQMAAEFKAAADEQIGRAADVVGLSLAGAKNVVEFENVVRRGDVY